MNNVMKNWRIRLRYRLILGQDNRKLKKKFQEATNDSKRMDLTGPGNGFTSDVFECMGIYGSEIAARRIVGAWKREKDEGYGIAYSRV